MFLTEEKQSHYQKLIVAAYFLAMICLGFAGSVFGPILNQLSEVTGTTAAQISLIFVMVGAGFVLSSLTFCRLFDKCAGHKLISVGLVILIICLYLLEKVTSLGQLLILAGCIGIGNSFIDIGCNTLLPWLLKEKAGTAFNYLHVCYAFGCFVTPTLISRAFQNSDSYKQVLTYLSIAILPVAILFFFLPSPQIVKTIENKSQEEKGRLPHSFLVISTIFALIFFLVIGAQASFNSWISHATLVIGLTDESGAAFFSSILWAGVLLGRIAGALVSRKLSPETISIWGLIISGAANLSLFLLRGSQVGFGISTFCIGFGMGPLFANLLLALKKKFVLSGKMNGFMFAANQIGSMLIPWIIGQTFSSGSIRPFMLITALCLIVTFALFTGIEKKYTGSVQRVSEEK